jgi:hypothetical protein
MVGPPSLESLAKEVGLLRDRQEISDCIHRYARGVDRHDEELLTSVYHADAIDEHGLAINAGPSFAEWLNGLHDKYFRVHQHHMTSQNCELDGDVAHCETYVLYGLETLDRKHFWFGGGRYVDRLEKRDAVWKIAHRRTMIDWMIDADPSIYHSDAFQAWKYPAGKLNRDDDSYHRPVQLNHEQAEMFERQGPTAAPL